MKRILVFLLLGSLGQLCLADEQTQEVQQALKDQGFYYGQVDGQAGPETDAAIRRYQIRQGLDVSGKLDEQTLESLNLGSSSKKDGDTVEAVPPPQSQQATPAPRGVVQSDEDFLKRHPSPAATPPPPPNDDNAPPPPPQPEAAEPAPPAEAAGTEYSDFFRKTPYESAPPVVQRSTVQRAQVLLGRQGFFRGVADGELGDSLSRALVAYQRDAELPPSGRLDMDTLSDLNLLPHRHVVIRAPAPFDYYRQPPDSRDVYRGLWVH